jgi:DinB superfamily
MLRAMTDLRTPAEHADQIRAARDRLLAFVRACPDDIWRSRPLAGQGDNRQTAVIADHVAHAYEYMGSFITQMLAGETPHFDAALIDRLNAEHAALAAGSSRAEVTEHLACSGDELIALVAGLTPADLEAAGGKVRRLAEISARHPDMHRTEIEDAIGRD